MANIIETAKSTITNVGEWFQKGLACELQQPEYEKIKQEEIVEAREAKLKVDMAIAEDTLRNVLGMIEDPEGTFTDANSGKVVTREMLENQLSDKSPFPWDRNLPKVGKIQRMIANGIIFGGAAFLDSLSVVAGFGLDKIWPKPDKDSMDPDDLLKGGLRGATTKAFEVVEGKVIKSFYNKILGKVADVQKFSYPTPLAEAISDLTQLGILGRALVNPHTVEAGIRNLLIPIGAEKIWTGLNAKYYNWYRQRGEATKFGIDTSRALVGMLLATVWDALKMDKLVFNSITGKDNS